MSFQSEQVRNVNPAQDQLSILSEAMNVVTDSAARHEMNAECRTPNDEGNPNAE